MTLDPKLIQWLASVLLVLSGVQNLVVVARSGMGAGLRALSNLIAVAAVAVGVLIIVTMLGAKA